MQENSLVMQGFAERHGAKSIFTRWLVEKDVSDFLSMQITGGVILVDALMGDGMRDHISPELLSAFQTLMGEKADSADKIRDFLVEKLVQGDAATAGFINNLKGYVGENMFVEAAAQAGFTARLADTPNQESWDCCLTSAENISHYIQIKTHASANAVVSQIKEVTEKVAAGQVRDGDVIVSSIGFAVPHDIYDEVSAKVAAAGLTVDVQPFALSAQAAGDIVQSGLDNVAYYGFGNFFEQWASAALTAAVIQALVQGLLLHKGSTSDTMWTIARETSLSAGGIGAALAAEGVLVKGLGVATGSFPAAAVLLATGLTARGLLRRMLIRHDYSGFLAEENKALQKKSMRYLPAPVSAVAQG